MLDELTSMDVNLNSYFDDFGYRSIIDDVVSARLKALAGYLRQLEMPDLLEVVLELDPGAALVETLETVRSYVDPEVRRRLDAPEFSVPKQYKLSTGDLLDEVEAQRGLMVSVATGGPRIDTLNAEYVDRRARIAGGLSERGIRDPNPYSDLWGWHGKWSSGDLPTYASRRAYLSEMYGPLLDELRAGPTVRVLEATTGWEGVDRGVDQIRRQLRAAESTEELQVVGLYCRETLISLGQEVFDPDRHETVDGVTPSRSDGKRMIEAFIAAELPGEANKYARKHAKAALDLANELQHERTATFKQAALCAEATVSVVNIVAVLSGRRGE